MFRNILPGAIQTVDARFGMMFNFKKYFLVPSAL